MSNNTETTKTTPDYFRDAYEQIKSLQDAEMILREIAKKNEVPDWIWLGTIIRRAHEVGYLEGKRYEKERLRAFLGLE